MKRCLVPLFIVMVLFSGGPARSDEPIKFADYFWRFGLRLDMYQIGDAKEEEFILGQMIYDDSWGGNPDRLIDPFDYGRYRFQIFDKASNRLIYSQGFDSMFSEYRTTPPAVAGTRRVLKRSLCFPKPYKPYVLVIEARDGSNILHPVLRQEMDPDDDHIVKDWQNIPILGINFVYDRLHNGDPDKKVDIVVLAEGYTKWQRDKFMADVDRMTEWLFETEPFKSRKSDFNIVGLFIPSIRSGASLPHSHQYKKTPLGSAANPFEIYNYLLVEDDHRLRDIAGQVPYDAIVVLANCPWYGGGGIYNDYCIVTADGPFSKQLFLREFGRSFAGLAEESFVADPARKDHYPRNVEPLEPNITALLDPAHVKWADLLSPGMSVPTVYAKEEVPLFQTEMLKLTVLLKSERRMAEARIKNDRPPTSDLKEAEAKMEALNARIEAFRKSNAAIADKVGVFEGAGYSSTGLYRPMLECLMAGELKQEFCPVCSRAISKKIDFYTGK